MQQWRGLLRWRKASTCIRPLDRHDALWNHSDRQVTAKPLTNILTLAGIELVSPGQRFEARDFTRRRSSSSSSSIDTPNQGTPSFEVVFLNVVYIDFYARHPIYNFRTRIK